MMSPPSRVYVLTAVIQCMIHITSGLRFTTEPSDAVAVLARPFWWHCVAEDTQSITYSWSINNQVLPLRLNQVIYSNGTLKINTLQFDDVGVYVCSATSSGGTTIRSREATLDVASISTTFSSNPQPQTAYLGDNVVLSCKIDSLPQANITWTLNGELVTMGTVNVSPEGESTLTLSPIMYHEAGVYKCVGTNQMLGVYRYSLEAEIVVRGQPVFLSSLRAVSVPLGYTATFNCHFYGNPEPEVKWLAHSTQSDGSFTSREILNSDKYTVNQNGTFHIYNVVQDDEAFYTCTVFNAFGEMSESAQLTVTGEATLPVFTTLPQNTTVKQGTNATFSCDCTGNPQPQINWKYNNILLVSNDHVTISSNGLLTISTVQSNEAGWYSCFCENAVGIVNQSAYLNVQVAAAIIIPPQDVTALAGDEVSLHCAALGNPDPTLVWNTPGSVIIDSTHSADGLSLHVNGSLTITSAAMRHAGIYTCTASNVVGSDSKEASVNVEFPPVMTRLPVSQSVNQGEKAYLHCQASGSPTPLYTWSKDGEAIIRSTAERQIYLNNTLVIHSVTLGDAGVYTCTPANTRGQVQAVASLTVNVPPSFTIKPDNQTTRIGRTVQLHCVAVGNPVPTQKWNKDGRLLYLDDNMEMLPDNSLLTIATIRQSQFGEYTCIASNMAGTIMASAWVKVDDLPVFTLVPQNKTVNQSETLFLQCQGRAYEVPSVSWFRIVSGVITLIEKDGRVSVTGNGDLSIQNVRQTDEGWYMCVIANNAGQISANVYTNVQVPPTIISTNTPQTVIYQSSVNLICQSTGDPAPTMQWISPHGDVVTASPAYLISDHTLEIKSANEYADGGNWICKSCNLLGCDQSVIKLNVEGRPLILSFQCSKSGNVVTLQCTASGLPSPAVTFTTQDQTVTAQFQGHSINSNTLSMDEEFVRKEYSCRAQNRHGTVASSVSVPSQVEPPSVTNIQSRWVTLRWAEPVDQSNLPLTGYQIQLTSNFGVSWRDVGTAGSDLLTLKHLNITELLPFTDYNFRVAGNNILGAGQYSGESATVRTLADAPSPPTDVVALIIEDGVILLSWKPPQLNNGPSDAIMYQYKVTEAGGQDTEAVLHQGVVFSNQTLQVEIPDVSKAVLYTATVWAVNFNLKKSSEPVTVTIDMTVMVPIPGDADSQSLDPEKIIAIVFGVLGGLAVVFILIFIVLHIRHQKKTESLSFIQPRPSLDQFYMENPKNLYNKESRHSKKRRSGQGFYNFDDDSFHSNGSTMKDNSNSSGKGLMIDRDVLLVARNPLYQETELMSPSNHPSRVGSTELLVPDSMQQSFAQNEIELPMAEIAENFFLKPARTEAEHDVKMEADTDADGLESGKESLTTPHSPPLTPLSARDLEEDIMAIYSTVNRSPPSEPDQSLDHVYSSIHSDRQSPPLHMLTSSTTSNKSSNSNSPKPPTRVMSPDKLRSTGQNAHDGQHDHSSGSRFSNSPTLSKKSKDSRVRIIRSVSPTVSGNADNSYSPKPPRKVLSLEQLRPPSQQSGSEMPSMYTQQISDNDSENSTDSAYMDLPFERYNSGENDISTEPAVINEFPETSFGSGSTSSKLKNVSFDSDAHSSKNSERLTPNSGEVIRICDIEIADNFLTEEEVHNEVASAELY